MFHGYYRTGECSMEHKGRIKSHKPRASCLFHDRVSTTQVRQSTDKLQQANEWKKNLDSRGRKSFSSFTLSRNWMQATSFIQRETTITWNCSWHSRYEKLRDAYTRFQTITLSCSTPSPGTLLSSISELKSPGSCNCSFTSHETKRLKPVSTAVHTALPPTVR